jgi:uncharacterized protein YlxW (UPF0749 family)
MSSNACIPDEASESISSKASAEQLMDYVKRQKLKIKKLTAENESLKSAAATASTATAMGREVGPGLETELESASNSRTHSANQVVSPERFLRCAVSRLLTLLTKLHSTTASSPTPISVVSSFAHWHRCVEKSRAENAEKELAQCRSANVSMEQRIAKLKALLARTHQANQRNLEEFDLLRKAKEAAENDVKAMEVKTKAELNSLREVVRSSSITSAFQYDIDILIQNAGTYSCYDTTYRSYKSILLP